MEQREPVVPYYLRKGEAGRRRRRSAMGDDEVEKRRFGSRHAWTGRSLVRRGVEAGLPERAGEANGISTTQKWVRPVSGQPNMRPSSWRKFLFPSPKTVLI
jgi:hypothetical protein